LWEEDFRARAFETELNRSGPRKSMLRASSNLTRHLTRQGARKFSAAAAESGEGGAGMSWLLGATVAALTAGAVIAVRSHHSVLLQQEVEWNKKIGGASSGGHHDNSHHGKH
jgi:hypothetical protein